MPRHAIATDRLRLEPKREEHTAASWNAIERSLPELKRFMSWAHFASPITTAEHMRAAETEWNGWKGWDFVIFLGDEVAGSIGLNRYDELWRSANLGYWVRSDVVGRGIATEAATAVIDFAFGEVNLNRLELVANVDNIASQRVAEKVGFQFEGIRRQGAWIGGRGVDVKSYGLLASDPRPGISRA